MSALVTLSMSIDNSKKKKEKRKRERSSSPSAIFNKKKYPFISLSMEYLMIGVLAQSTSLNGADIKSDYISK